MQPQKLRCVLWLARQSIAAQQRPTDEHSCLQVKLGAVQWRAKSQLTESSGPPRLASVTLKAELLEQVPKVSWTETSMSIK